MGGNGSTAKKVSFGLDEEEKVTVIKGVKLSGDVLQRMQNTQDSKSTKPQAPQSESHIPPPSPKLTEPTVAEVQDDLRRKFEREQALVQEQLARLAQKEREVAAAAQQRAPPEGLEDLTPALIMERCRTHEELEKSKALATSLLDSPLCSETVVSIHRLLLKMHLTTPTHRVYQLAPAPHSPPRSLAENVAPARVRGATVSLPVHPPTFSALQAASYAGTKVFSAEGVTVVATPLSQGDGRRVQARWRVSVYDDQQQLETSVLCRMIYSHPELGWLLWRGEPLAEGGTGTPPHWLPDQQPRQRRDEQTPHGAASPSFSRKRKAPSEGSDDPPASKKRPMRL